MERKSIKTKRISAGTRVYYIDAFVDKKGQPFIAISEIPTGKCPGKKKRQRIFIHLENVNKFAKMYREVARFVRKCQ